MHINIYCVYTLLFAGTALCGLSPERRAAERELVAARAPLDDRQIRSDESHDDLPELPPTHLKARDDPGIDGHYHYGSAYNQITHFFTDGKLCRRDQGLADIPYADLAKSLSDSCGKSNMMNVFQSQFAKDNTLWKAQWTGCRKAGSYSCSDLVGRRGDGDGGHFQGLVDSCKRKSGRLGGGMYQTACGGILALEPVNNPDANVKSIPPWQGLGTILTEDPCDSGKQSCLWS